MAEIIATDKKVSDNTAADMRKDLSMDDLNAAELVKADKKNVDEAFAAFQGYGDIVVDEATDKRLLRRIDKRILPIMCLIYGMYDMTHNEMIGRWETDKPRNYLDKTTLSYSSIMGLQTDIGLVRDNYQWLGSIFYFGYLVNISISDFLRPQVANASRSRDLNGLQFGCFRDCQLLNTLPSVSLSGESS